MHDLPPLKALRAFEACFRHNSFTRAAQSLNVGQPAISHQILVLENDLGIQLFKKHGPRIEPTDDARTYYASIQPALKAIADASRRARSGGMPTGIRIGAYPGLATYWLAPRLTALSNSHPEIEVRLTTAEQDHDLSFDKLDCAILFGDGSWPETQSVRLIDEEVIPVCSPELFETWKDADADELAQKAPLIELSDQNHRWFNWQDWMTQFDVKNRSSAKLTVSNHALALHQAIAGQGIVLAWRGVVSDLLAQKTLCSLPSPPLISGRGYYLVAKTRFLVRESGILLTSFLKQ